MARPIVAECCIYLLISYYKCPLIIIDKHPGTGQSDYDLATPD